MTAAQRSFHRRYNPDPWWPDAALVVAACVVVVVSAWVFS